MTYYIDYATGADSNSGTSKGSPWKSHPFMPTWTGSGYSHTIGDRFIFKGGVAWPNACFGFDISVAGNSVTSDYYGADTTWFTGGSFARPIFDCGGLKPASGSNIIFCGSSYIVIDNLELTGLYWDSSNQAFGLAVISINTQTNVVIQNCYIHNWTHDTAAHGCADALNVILGSTTTTNPGCQINNCIIDGNPSGSDSAIAVYCVPVVQNCVIRNIRSGPLQNGDPCIMSGCTIGPLNVSFNGAHGAAFEPQGEVGSQYCFNNVIHNSPEVGINIGGAAGPTGEAWVYNNIIYNSGVGVLLKWASGATNKAHVWNNVIDISNSGSPDYAILSELGTWAQVDAQNNLIIGTTGFDITASTGAVDHNLFYATSAAAISAGFTVSALYFPPLVTSPTVSAGTTAPNSVFTTSLNGVTRSGAQWDIGPYQWDHSVGGKAVPVITPDKMEREEAAALSAAIVVGSMSTLAAQVAAAGYTGGTISTLKTSLETSLSVDILTSLVRSRNLNFTLGS